MIKIKDLIVKFKTLSALDNFSAEIPDGCVYALLGLNGAGKTTLINVLCSLQKKNSGTVIIDKYDIDKDSIKAKELIAIAPQETALDDSFNVYDNIKLMADLYNIPNKKDRIDEVIEEMHLTKLVKRNVKKLSGGQRRKVSIAMALIAKPKYLFLDEPTVGLDIISRNDLWQLLKKLQKNMTIIFTTHYIEEAEQYADTIGIIKHGQLSASGTVKQLIKKTNTATFTDAFVILSGGRDE